ncbi:MAG: hypothetical protein M3O46_09940, partial [Myxococcota bacterium]|nr:hypothetical protein [Myxococcota bacterium]
PFSARPDEPARKTWRGRTDPPGGDLDLTTLRQGGLGRIFRAMKVRLRSASTMLGSRDSRGAGRIAAAFPITVIAAALGAVGLIILVAMAIRGRGVPTGLPSPVATVLPTATVLPARRPSVPEPGATVGVCAIAGDPHVLAPSAIVAAGIEMRAFGGDVALGFAPNEHQAMLLRLDPTSLAPLESTAIPSVRRVLRATPIPGKRGRLGLAVDVGRKGDPLQGRRTVPLDPPIQVGVASGALAWAPLGGRRVQGSLWPLEGDGAVEALRGTRSESNLSTVGIAFRRASAVWVGIADRSASLVAKGPMLRVPGLGPVVGSPAIAVNEGVVFVVWADRPSPDDPWRLRWMHFKVGEASSQPTMFTPPTGSKNDEAMSPALTVVPGGRFLLIWTEGPASAHEVRAMTLSADAAQIGSPLRLSNGGVNAGQGQVAVTASGRGVVAFLESRANGFRLVATPIVCTPDSKTSRP